jgi:hypothetical protein
MARAASQIKNELRESKITIALRFLIPKSLFGQFLAIALNLTITVKHPSNGALKRFNLRLRM